MTRDDVIEAGLALRDYGDDIHFNLRWLYNDDYIDFVGVELFDGQIIKCDEADPAVMLLNWQRDKKSESGFFMRHADEATINHHCHEDDNEPSFNGMTSMLYLSECGLFEVRVALDHYYGRWTELWIKPAREIGASEFDAHMTKHYPEIWEKVFDEMEQDLLQEAD